MTMRRIARALTLSLAVAAAAPVAYAGEPQAKPTASPLAQVGQKAPDFNLVDQDGKTHTLSQYKGKIVVLEWTNPGCPFVRRHYEADTMETLSKTYGGKGVVWLAVNSTSTNTA